MFAPSIRKTRTCLRCGRRFLSLSAANRICPPCKKITFGAYADITPLDPDDLRELRRVGRGILPLF